MQYTLKTMKKPIQEQLLGINRDFYDQFAPSFSATRDRAQTGAQNLIERLPVDAAVLDVGCGNGTFARALARSDFRGQYLGVDMSVKLLDEAVSLTGQPITGYYQFAQADLSKPGWESDLSHLTFDWLVCFAVLHHLPGDELRLKTVAAFRQLLAPQGSAAVSVWQWQNSAKLRKRVLPWSTVDCDLHELDEGDVLLDWRAGKTPGLRYVHTFTQQSLTSLAERAGFIVAESFYSDGKAGDLALYQIWRLDNLD